MTHCRPWCSTSHTSSSALFETPRSSTAGTAFSGCTCSSAVADSGASASYGTACVMSRRSSVGRKRGGIHWAGARSHGSSPLSRSLRRCGRGTTPRGSGETTVAPWSASTMLPRATLVGWRAPVSGSSTSETQSGNGSASSALQAISATCTGACLRGIEGPR